MDRRLSVDAGAVDHHWPGPHEPNCRQRRALQPHPCRDFLFSGTVGAARFRKPQRHAGRRRRHPRRLHAAARRSDSHRPFADGICTRSGGRVSRFFPGRARGFPIARYRVGRQRRRIRRAIGGRANENYPPPRANSISRARSRRGGRYSQSGPGRGATLSSGVRDGQSARRYFGGPRGTQRII